MTVVTGFVGELVEVDGNRLMATVKPDDEDDGWVRQVPLSIDALRSVGAHLYRRVTVVIKLGSVMVEGAAVTQNLAIEVRPAEDEP